MEAIFTEAQRVGLQALAEGTIDDQWIKGVRAGWKALAKQTRKFRGRRSKAPKIDFQYIYDASEGGEAALQNVKRYIGRLRDDLLLNKGFWDLPSEAQGKKEVSMIRRYKTKVIDELDAAEEAIDDGIMRVTGAKTDAQEVDRFGHTGYWYKRLQNDKEKFDWYLNGIGVNVDNAVEEADKAISGRLLRHLTKILATSYSYSMEYPTTGSEKWRSKKRYVKKQVPIDWGEHEPEVVHLGKATVVFQDMPRIGDEPHSIISPRKVGSHSYTKSGGSETKLTSRTKYGGGYMHPRRRAEFVDGLKQAQGMLRAVRLGKLFRGHFIVEPKERAGTNQHGAHFGVGGRYYRKGDKIHLYGSLKVHDIPGLAIHEIGHRYWYKHMTRQDRANFSKWFGDVPAVSEYGGVSPAEDFAEVFMFYVMKQKLTKDQHDRFRQFMTGHRPRTESLEEGTATKAQKCKYCDEPAAVSLIWADGRAYIPVCKAHERKARNQIASQNDSVCDVKQVEQGPIAPRGRMEQALRPALDFVEEAPPGAYFGLQADPRRAESALAEAPAESPPRASIGRRDTPRGALFRKRTSSDMQGVKAGKPIKRSTGKGVNRRGQDSRGSVERPDRTRQEIPDSLLQMLGSDWSTMQARRVHDNRMTINIDGVRYSVYTRKG